MAARDDALVSVRPLLELIPDWAAFIGEGEDDSFNERLRGHAMTGRPLGSDAFFKSLGRQLARTLKRKKPGPKPQHRTNETERALRLWVIARRIGMGTRTDEGTHAFANLASVIETCRKRGLSPWPCLAVVIRQRRQRLAALHLPLPAAGT